MAVLALIQKIITINSLFHSPSRRVSYLMETAIKDFCKEVEIKNRVCLAEKPFVLFFSISLLGNEGNFIELERDDDLICLLQCAQLYMSVSPQLSPHQVLKMKILYTVLLVKPQVIDIPLPELFIFQFFIVTPV